MVRSEGDMSLKNPVTPRGIDPRTVQLVAQRLNHYAIPGPKERCVYTYIYLYVCVRVCVIHSYMYLFIIHLSLTVQNTSHLCIFSVFVTSTGDPNACNIMVPKQSHSKPL